MSRNAVLIITLIFSMVAIEMDAQYKRRYRRSGSELDIRYGIKLGYQVSNFTGDENLVEFNSDNSTIYPPVIYNSYNSFHGGAYIDIRVSESFIVQPEIQFVGMGTEMVREADLNNPEQNFLVTPSSNPGSIVEVPIERRLSYLQLPIIAKIGLTRQVHLNLGPVISFKVSEENVYGNIPDSLVTTLNFTDPDAPDLYNSLDYGAILGLSYQMDNGLNFGIRYNRNFSNINKNEGLGLIAIEPTNSTTSILFNLGYTFQYDSRLRESIGRRY
ncbi:MAG: PorT family protein [Flavobacteriales bacterium]|nr:PorT family protein [Flavobacteriales bacterium]